MVFTYVLREAREEEFLGLLECYWSGMERLGVQAASAQLFRCLDAAGRPVFVEVVEGSADALLKARHDPRLAGIRRLMEGFCQELRLEPDGQIPEGAELLQR